MVLSPLSVSYLTPSEIFWIRLVPGAATDGIRRNAVRTDARARAMRVDFASANFAQSKLNLDHRRQAGVTMSHRATNFNDSFRVGT
jgi:hypothetical protein